MTHRRALATTSAVQLLSGLAGQGVALRRRRHFDIPAMRGSAGTVGRDSLWAGTALSAPVHMLGAQAWATARLAARPDEAARRTLAWLGVVMVPGYLMERLARHRLTPAGFDPVETPIVVVGLAGAVAMAALGRPTR